MGRNLLVELRDEPRKRDADRRAECTRFHDVEPPFASLALADERLSLSQAFRELDLGHAGASPSVAQTSEEDVVFL